MSDIPATNPRLQLFADLVRPAFAFLEERGYRVTETEAFGDRGIQVVYVTQRQFVQLVYDSYDGSIVVNLGALPVGNKYASASLLDLTGFSQSAYEAAKLPEAVRRTAEMLLGNEDLLETDLPTEEVRRFRDEVTEYYGNRPDDPRPPRRSAG